MKPCTIYLIRHGETEWNVQRRIQGHSDSPLTDAGVEQARQRAKSLAGVKFAAVYSSDLLRAKDTAEIFALEHQLAVVTSDLLRERNHGRFEGKTADEFNEELRDLLEYRLTLPDDNQHLFSYYDGYESDDQVATRLISILRQIAVAYPGKNVAVVSHSGSLRVLMRRFGYAMFIQAHKAKVRNTAYIVLESDGIEFTVTETEGVELGE